MGPNLPQLEGDCPYFKSGPSNKPEPDLSNKNKNKVILTQVAINPLMPSFPGETSFLRVSLSIHPVRPHNDSGLTLSPHDSSLRLMTKPAASRTRPPNSSV